MKPGRVVKIRLNPMACMACVDVVNKVGAYRDGISFAQVVILALESAIAAFKANGLIPDRDGFDYSELMAPYKDQPHIDRARKLELTHIIEKMHKPIEAIVVDPTVARIRRRYDELCFKSNNDPDNMDAAERAELQQLVQELNPL